MGEMGRRESVSRETNLTNLTALLIFLSDGWEFTRVGNSESRE